MTAVFGHLEPIEYSWAESAFPRTRQISRTSAVRHLRTVAAMVWFGWLIAAGLVVGGTALVVVARIAWVVLRWAVAL